jgi:hypothetical protein
MTLRAVVVVLVLALGACAHELTFDRAHALGCREACARLAADGEHGSASGWYVGDHTCGCRFDDGTIDSTCERPVDGRCE